MAFTAWTADTAALADNAALHYWKSSALLTTPRSVDDLAVLTFIEQELPKLPPSAFNTRTAEAQWLLRDKPAMDMLVRGASKGACDFGVFGDRFPAVDLTHLPAMSHLTRRALQAAKALEYLDNRDGSTAIYVSLLKLAQHLDQDQTIGSALVSAEIVQAVMLELEGYLARTPPSIAVAPLARHLASIPTPMLHPGDYLRRETERYGAWLEQDPGGLEDRLARLYGGATRMPAVEQLQALTPERRLERLRGWLDDYRRHMNNLAETLEKPHAIGYYALKESDDLKVSLRDQPPGPETNPLLPLLLPTIVRTYERILLVEGHLGIMDVLGAAALYRADLKKWPASLQEVSTFVGRSFRRDPFTGQEIQYRLRSGYPAIGIRAPKWLSELTDVTDHIGLADRLKRDEERLEALRKQEALELRRALLEKAKEDKQDGKK